MLRTLLHDEDGFSFIELLVVILVIGILAAIAIPVFIGQERKGQDASAKSDARNAVAQVETCFIDERDYARCDDAADQAMYDSEVDWSRTEVSTAGIGTDLFRVDARSGSDNHFFVAKRPDGSFARTCTTAGTGACRSDSTW